LAKHAKKTTTGHLQQKNQGDINNIKGGEKNKDHGNEDGKKGGATIWGLSGREL